MWLTLTQRVYWKYLVLFSVSFVLIFAVVGIILYAIIIPWGMGLSMVLLGPLGVVLLHLQWLLMTNVVANQVCHRILLPNLNWQVYKLTVSQYNVSPYNIDVEAYENPHLKRDSNDLWWFIGILGWGKNLVQKIGTTVISFIPIIGPLVVNVCDTNERTRKCLDPFFKEQNWSKDQIKQFEISRRADFVAFGLVSGILESIPLVSIITMTSNIVAGGLWAVELFKSKESRKKE